MLPVCDCKITKKHRSQQKVSDLFTLRQQINAIRGEEKPLGRPTPLNGYCLTNQKITVCSWAGVRSATPGGA